MQLFINALIAGSLGALIAGGLALVYGILGIFNLALGQLALIGGYTTWWLHQGLGLPLPLAILGGMLLGGIVTWASYEIAIRPFEKRHPYLPLITTIALGMILDSLILLFFEERPRSILAHSKQFLNTTIARISSEQLALILLTLILIITAAIILHTTSLGRKIRATVQQSEAAQSIGISASLLHRGVFITSGILAGLGGIYLGIDQNLSPTLGFPITIKAYAALIVGGKTNLFGTILGAYFIALLEQLAIGIPWFSGTYISPGYQSIVALLLIIIVLLIRPSGLFSSSTRTT